MKTRHIAALLLSLSSALLLAAEDSKPTAGKVDTVDVVELTACFLVIDKRTDAKAQIDVGGKEFATESDAVAYIKTVPKRRLGYGILVVSFAKTLKNDDPLVAALKDLAKTTNSDLYYNSETLNDKALHLHKKSKE